MKKILIFASALAMVLTISAPLSTTTASAEVRHGGGGHGGGHAGGGFHGGGFHGGGRGGHNYGGRSGGGYGGGNGGYYGGYGGFCGPIQITLGLCGPYGY